MDVYRQAAEIVKIVQNGRGTAKALCLRKEMQKKKQTYAVVCETLRHYELLQDVLTQAEFFQYYPHASKDLAVVLSYDCVIGKGINTRSDSTALAVDKCGPYLREAYERVRRHHVIVPRQQMEKWDDDGVEGGGGAMAVPRYARINTLKIDAATLMERLRRPKRERDDQQQPPSRHVRHLPPFTQDAHVPNLIVFPPGTDMHSHPSVRSGQLILQDKASCLPACVLLDDVPVVSGTEAACPKTKQSKPSAAAATSPDNGPSIEFVIDACAAPGNKTTHLAAIGAARGVKLLAVERDAKRAHLLSQRVNALGGAEHINVVNQDFFDLTSDVRDVVEAVLLDPSCSASGVVSRVDVAITRRKPQKRASSPDEDGLNSGAVNDDDDDEEAGEDNGSSIHSNARVAKLAQVQKKLLTHALLSFPNCHRVVYSTCSVHNEENEEVVRAVMLDERVQQRGWALANIMPKTWSSRGRRLADQSDAPSSELPLHYTIRCDPLVDKTNGFYVARFDRAVPVKKLAAPSEATTEATTSDPNGAVADGAAASTAPKHQAIVEDDEEAKRLRRAAPKIMHFSSDDDDD